MKKPKLYILLYMGAVINFTPNDPSKVNVMYVKDGILYLDHIVGNHVEQMKWEFTSVSTEEAMQVLINDGVWPLK